MSERLFCYYGDDFTGSTDALEALAANGVESVLFLDPPDERHLARFPAAQAIGVAGESRSHGPEWMERQLPQVFQRLKEYGAPVCQYKVCSTFDSSPEYGSIGKALEIGQEAFRTPWVPIVVAAPHLQRFVLFGNLFAAGAGGIHRIDRHPTMRHHPVTPMEESDLRYHLARQTRRRIALLDILALIGGCTDAKLDELLEDRPAAVLFDGLDEASLEVTGRLVWERRKAGGTFAVGSAGLTHALIRHWRRSGMIPAAHTPEPARQTERIIVISGSCSPLTEGQIRWAMAHGYAGMRVDPTGLGRDTMIQNCLMTLSEGRSLVLYTALGPQDCQGGARGKELGRYLGLLLRELVLRSNVRRAVVAGGDTSSHSVRQLGIEALTFAGLTTPGAPLCQAHAATPAMDGLELVLKGGQVGPEHYFEIVRRGRA